MGRIRIELNRAGVGQLLKSDEMKALVQGIGDEAVARAGEGYAARTHNTGQRMICNVYPTTKESAKDNYENNTLLKAVGG